MNQLQTVGLFSGGGTVLVSPMAGPPDMEQAPSEHLLNGHTCEWMEAGRGHSGAWGSCRVLTPPPTLAGSG